MPKTRFLENIFVADYTGLTPTNFTQFFPKGIKFGEITQNNVITRFKVISR